MDVKSAARRWADFFENLTPETLNDLRSLCVPDVRFKDPFNDHTGIEPVTQVFVSMFETTDEPKFTVQRIAIDEATAFLSWTFTFRRKGTMSTWKIDGVSEVSFDDAGLVVSHLDHWDASQQFYARLPVVGWLIRYIARRVGV